MRTCSKCHKQFSDEFEFCPYCGIELLLEGQIPCPKCNKIIKNEFKFCPYCRQVLNEKENFADLTCNDNLEMGKNYYYGKGIEKNYSKAAAIFNRFAEQGNLEAQTLLGIIYENGEGVSQDYSKACYWYQKAAEKNDTNALFRLGRMFDRGQGVSQDYTKAAEYFLKAAEQGHAYAQYNIGSMYEDGEGVEQDSVKAVAWFRKAAEQGIARAQYKLGYMYDNGEGVEENLSKAIEWYNKAAEQGHDISQFNLGYMYAHGEGVEQDYAKAVKWYEKAAEQGHRGAQLNLGLMYEDGEGVKQDSVKAAELFKKAAEQGHSGAQFNLGVMYDKGNGVEQNQVKAAEWFKKAAEQGHIDAQFNLAARYDKGNGVPQDYAKAAEWYEKVAERGDEVAQYNLGHMYYIGEGVEQDYTKAAEWFMKAAEQGHEGAQNNLGVMYYNGEGVAQDYVKAAELLREAAEQGNARAQYKLGQMYEKGEGVLKNFEKAVEWYQKAAKQGHYKAKANLLTQVPDGFPVFKLQELEEKAKMNSNYLLDNEVNDFLPASINTPEAIDFVLDYLHSKGITIVFSEDGEDENTDEETATPNPSDISTFKLLQQKILDTLDTLSSREKEVMELRLGLKDGRVRTLEEVGQHFGVTRERIRQIEAKSLRRMHKNGMPSGTISQLIEMLQKYPSILEFVKDEPKKTIKFENESEDQLYQLLCSEYRNGGMNSGGSVAAFWFSFDEIIEWIDKEYLKKTSVAEIKRGLCLSSGLKDDNQYNHICEKVLNEKRLEEVKSHYSHKTHTYSDNDLKWLSNFVEIVLKRINFRIFTSEILNITEYFESVLSGSDKKIGESVPKEDYGRLLISLMDNFESTRHLYTEERKWFAFCVIVKYFIKVKDSKTSEICPGLVLFTSVDKLLAEYEYQYVSYFFKTVDNSLSQKSNDSEQEQLEYSNEKQETGQVIDYSNLEQGTEQVIDYSNEEQETEQVIKSDNVLNKDRYEKLKSYLESFNRTEKDWVKWMIKFVEVASKLTNYKIDDKVIITFYLYSESILTGSKPDVFPARLLLLNDYGRLLIGLMSKIDSMECLTNEEKRMFAWCIIGSCCSEDDKFKLGISMCSSVHNVVTKYKDYGKYYFETLDNYPRYDNHEPLGSIRNPVTVITPKDATIYINQLEFDKNDSWYAYCHFDSIVREEHTKGLFNEHNLTLYKIDVMHFNPRMSCVRRLTEQIYLYVNEAGIIKSDNPPNPMSISCYANKGKRSYTKLYFKRGNNSIELSKICAAFSEFSLQFVSSEKTWHDCGLKTPSEFGSISSFFSSKQNLLKRTFLEEEFHALVTGILVRDLVDFFPGLLSKAEYLANMILGFQFTMLKKSDDESLNRIQLSLKRYLYDNLIDLEIFKNNASRAGIDLATDKQLLNAINKLMDYCYKESHSFLKEHSYSIIINDLPS